MSTTEYKTVSRKEIHNAISISLRNATDWDGNRGEIIYVNLHYFK